MAQDQLNRTASLWLLVALLLPMFASAQVLPDQIWLHGTNDIPGQPGHGNAYLKFENGFFYIYNADLRMNFESTMAVMPDSAGNILFYTNGCHIANAQGDTMPNGAGLNPGTMHDFTCPTSGYASPLGAMALQLPNSPNLYYLFHMGVRYGPDRKLGYGPFYYTTVDMGLDGGKGAVVAKNIVAADGNFEPFTAVRHGNGRDWWIVFPEYGTNKYHKFLFSADGLRQESVQPIGQGLACRYIGSSAFSPNGIRYARQQHCGVVALDFDRCSGEFSNDRFLPLPPNAFGGGGVAFNKNGDRLMVSTQLAILAANLAQPDPKLDTIVGSLDIAGSSLHLMQYGPDGKIYLSNLGRGKFYHVINRPDDLNIDFKQRWYDLSRFAVRTLPNFPNHRLYDLSGSPCDTLGISVSTKGPPFASAQIRLWPNPADGSVRVALPFDRSEGVLVLTDLWGRLLYQHQVPEGTESVTIPTQALPDGSYTISFKGPLGEPATQKLVVKH